jgi:hypothetical protein
VASHERLKSQSRYRSLRERAQLVTILLILSALLLVLDVVYVARNVVDVRRLHDENLRLEQSWEDTHSRQSSLMLAIGRDTLYHQMPDRYLRRNVRERILIWLGLALSLAAWLRWQQRAHRNLRALQVQDLRYSPPVAVLGWLVPLANLVLPLLTVRELWQASHRDPPAGKWQSAPASLVSMWWGVSLAWVVLYAVALLLLLNPKGQEVLLALYLMLASDGLAVLTLSLGVRLVSSIGHWQSTRHLLARPI